MQHDPSSKFEGPDWATETWTFSAYATAAHRVLSGASFDEHCCTATAGGESDFDTSKCVCAANIREDSDKAHMACHLMKNVEKRAKWCPSTGSKIGSIDLSIDR